MIDQVHMKLPSMGRGLHLITDLVLREIPRLPERGLLHVFIRHTSAGLTLNENADPTARRDLMGILDRLVPENHRAYTHTLEGSDDMPSHAKSSLVGASVTVPISGGRLDLGTWQGIYLCEFRNRGGPRHLVVTIYW
jgi:secondary thiamine-phosphate synthase enzyme